MVGVYNPVGVERARAISVLGRMVSVGLPDPDVEFGVIEDLKSGHSVMAFDSVFSRIGRYVNRVYRPPSGTSGGDGGGYSDDGETTSSFGFASCGGRKCRGM